MDKISVFDLKKLGLLTGDSDDIYVVTEINRKLEDGDILAAFDMVAHAMDSHVESLEDDIDELEADLNDTNDDLEEAENRVNYLEDILNKHNISY